MSSNYWQSQNNQNGPAGPENQNQPRKSGLLSNYAAQQGTPNNSPMPQGPPISPVPSQNNQPAPYNGQSMSPTPPPSPQQPWNGPTFMARPMQMVQRLSAKMAALRPPSPSSVAPNAAPPQPWNGPAFMARPMQMVQRLSTKMAALRRSGPPSVDPNPLVRYHSPQTPTPARAKTGPIRPLPWRRSRTQRITHLRKKRLERWEKSGPGSKRLSRIILAAVIGLLVIMLTSSTGYAYNFYQSELPQVQNLANLQIPQSTHIYDRHGVLLDTLYQNTAYGEGGRSTPISYKYLPGVLQDAQTAAEDPTFWSNDGIDPQGMLRALTEYASDGGQVQSGGSTITQQLIKNLSHQTQDTFQRKADEAALAIGLTQQYPKWKILEMYFNVTPYGAQDQGVEAAVQDYFGLHPQCDANHNCIPATAFLDRDLTKCKTADETTCAVDPILALTRAALLAGIPQNPTHFDPSVSDDNFTNVITNRLPYVLQQMQQNGMDINLGLGDPTQHKIDMGPITDAVIAQVEARAKTMTIVGFHQTQLAPHFVQWVIRTLANSLGNYQDLDLNGISIPGYQLLLTGGFNIYTTLDLNLEQFIEKDITANLNTRLCQTFIGCGVLASPRYNVHDSAAVVMDAQTGEILAMDGSADYNDTSDPKVAGNVNAATAYRQPGSSIKPIVYAAAFEKGWYPGIKLIDGKTYFPDGASQQRPAQTSTYMPTDYGHGYHPTLPTDIRISLANSFNIPAIKTLMFAGVDNVVDMARRLGITAIDRDLAVSYPGETPLQAYGPSFALGTAEIPLYQMVGAYQAFADNGIHVPYHNILDIYDNYGHDLYHFDPTHPGGVQVLSPQITFMLNAMLSDNIARQYEFAGLPTLTMQDEPGDPPVAAKTGTTDSFIDNWTIGYTSSVVVGVWSGNADGNDPMENVIGITGAGPIWHDIIEYASGYSKLGMTPDIHYPANPFPQPSGVIRSSVNPINGLRGSGVTDWMLVNEQPQQSGLPAPVCDPNNPNPSPNCPPPTGNNNPYGNISGTTGNGMNPSGDGGLDPFGN